MGGACQSVCDMSISGWSFVCRWEVDNDYCLKMMRQKMSPYYHGLLEFTDTAIYDYLMGEEIGAT